MAGRTLMADEANYRCSRIANLLGLADSASQFIGETAIYVCDIYARCQLSQRRGQRAAGRYVEDAEEKETGKETMRRAMEESTGCMSYNTTQWMEASGATEGMVSARLPGIIRYGWGLVTESFDGGC